MSIIKKLLFTLFTIVIALIFVEIGLRLFWKEPTTSKIPDRRRYVEFFPHANKDINYTLPPNYTHADARVKTNSWGFRGTEFDKKEPTDFRIIALGDSNMFGTRVNHNLTIMQVLRMRLRLSNYTGFKRIIFANLAIPGHTIRQYREMLFEYGDRLKPNFVMCGISIYNDLNGIFQEYFKDGLICQKFIYSVSGENWKLVAPNWFGKNTYIGRLLYSKFGKVGEFQTEPKKFLSASIDINDALWDETFEKILDMKEWCAKRNVPLVLVIFPTSAQLDYYKEISRKPQEILEDFLRKNKILYVDLFDPYFDYRWLSDRSPCLDHTHPNAEANDIAGNLVYDLAVKTGQIKNNLPLKEYVDIGTEGDQDILSMGWGERIREKDGTTYRWTMNGESKFFMPPVNEDMKWIEIRLKGFVCNFKSKDLYLEPIINGKHLAAIKIECRWMPVRFPANNLKKNEYNEVVLKFNFAVSPAEISKDKDKRKFSAAVDYFKLL
jgi:lysophospholipase L1-like esterase